MWVGIQGESAYQSWLNTGHEGTEEDFIEYLKTHIFYDLSDASKEIAD